MTEPTQPGPQPDPPAFADPLIEVLENGPYRVSGPVILTDTDGQTLRTSGVWHICRCGGSRNKPFCDTTHGLKHFDGTETASQDTIADRRAEYATDSIDIFDDRTRCAHFGQCTDRLPHVFRASQEPFVDPAGDTADAIVDVVRDCPSGALAYRRHGHNDTEEAVPSPSITPLPDGPYRVRGSIPVIGADGRPYEVRARQTLCRCGLSANKPFCDGSHWYGKFRDPVPRSESVAAPTILHELGGYGALLRLTTLFYDRILNEPDPLLEPLFRHMDAQHPAHVAMWLAEVFGGPQDYTTTRGGYEHMVAAHLGKRLTEPQRQRWLHRLLAAADDSDLTSNPDVRSAFVAYLEWGSRLAVYNSQADADVTAHGPVPRWGWGESAPYVPSPWDDPEAASRGRMEYQTGQQPPDEQP